MIVGAKLKNDSEDDVLVDFGISETQGPAPEASGPLTPWNILIVDDDEEVHQITRVVLADCSFKGRPLNFLSAYSAAEAESLLADHSDIAVILLDVVMETEFAGLRLVRKIREEFANNKVRVILRTGQPGQAPERNVIIDYDINDYKAKTELTAQKLFTAMISALRSYQDIVTIEASRRDITALKMMEEELRSAKEEAEHALSQLRKAQDGLIQAEKMAALGSLVAGIAHEINTPIGTALTSASYLSERSKEFAQLFEGGQLKRSDLTRYVSLANETSRLMLTNIERAAELVQSFKQVAVDQTSSERRRYDLKIYLGEVLLSLRPRLRRSKVTVEVDCPENLEVDGYPGALSHVLTNFVLNSLLHAFEPEQRGHIRIEAERSGPNEVRLRYSDDGMGIPDEIIGRIFEPFFTTRRGSGGSGLGLHIVYNMVTRNLAGTLQVNSEVGKGTSFDLSFPQQLPADSAEASTAGGLSSPGS